MKKNNSVFRRIGIAAPASPCDPEKLNAGLALLRESGAEPVLGRHLSQGAALPYLSAEDQDRADDFNQLAEDPSIDAILCTRGGYGTPRILPMLNYEVLRQRNLPVIGFSDITALHLAMLAKQAGRPVASQMAARLPEVLNNPETADGIQRIFALLSGEKGSFRKQAELSVIKSPGKEISGGIIPLNLTLVSALCGTEYLPSMKGRIVVLEEIGEPVRKLDRMLIQLCLSGFFNGACALVFGQFSDCGEEAQREILFRSFADRINIPVYTGLPYGHDLPSMSLIFEEPCKIRGNTLFLQQAL